MKRKISIPVVAAVSCFVISAFVRMSATIVMPVYAQQFNLSASFVGLISGMYFIPYACIQLLSGPLCRRFGVGSTVIVFLCLGIAGLLFMAFAQNGFMVLCGRFLMGLGMGPVFVATVSILQKYYSGAEYVRVYSLAILLSNLGSALASAPLKFIVEHFGIKNLFFSVAFVVLICIFIFKYVSRDDEKQKDDSAMVKDVFGTLKRAYKTVSSYYVLKCGILFWIFHSSAMLVYQGLWSTKWAAVAFPAFERFSGWTGTVASIGVMFACFMGDAFGKNTSRGKKTFTSAAMLTCTFSLLIIAQLLNDAILSFVFLLVCDFVFGYACGFVCVQIGASVKETVSTEENGTVMGMFNFTSSMFSYILQNTSGLLVDLFALKLSMKYSFACAFALLFIPMLVGLFFIRGLITDNTDAR